MTFKSLIREKIFILNTFHICVLDKCEISNKMINNYWGFQQTA